MGFLVCGWFLFRSCLGCCDFKVVLCVCVHVLLALVALRSLGCSGAAVVVAAVPLLCRPATSKGCLVGFICVLKSLQQAPLGCC